jgi:hypothetical protein
MEDPTPIDIVPQGFGAGCPTDEPVNIPVETE